MNIIILGTGKAAILHFNKYKKIVNTNKIFFVNPFHISKFDYPVYKTLDYLFSKENINCEDTIVDICTPHSEFKKIIKQCMEKKLYNIIVEKPFIVDEKYFLDKQKLNIIMVQNYLFSKMVVDAKKIIKRDKLVLIDIYTNFSKNRIVDSSRYRGIKNKVTTAFEIEIPHQIYIANSFLDNNTEKELIKIDAKDMIINNLILKNHGYGYVCVNNENVLIVHESNLMSKDISKQIFLNLRDNYSIIISFITYDKNFKGIKDGKLTILKKNKIVEEYIYENDDNILEFLKYAYNAFISRNTKIFIKQKKFIISFSKELNLYLETIKKASSD